MYYLDIMEALCSSIQSRPKILKDFVWAQVVSGNFVTKLYHYLHVWWPEFKAQHIYSNLWSDKTHSMMFFGSRILAPSPVWLIY